MTKKCKGSLQWGSKQPAASSSSHGFCSRSDETHDTVEWAGLKDLNNQWNSRGIPSLSILSPPTTSLSASLPPLPRPSSCGCYSNRPVKSWALESTVLVCVTLAGDDVAANMKWMNTMKIKRVFDWAVIMEGEWLMLIRGGSQWECARLNGRWLNNTRM